MNRLTPQDLLAYTDYERERPAYRREIIELKKRRRISVGPLITLVFENRETVLFQVQEMIRTERIFDPQKVQEELSVYNALLPDDGQLSATLFIEITDHDRMKELLDSFQAIDRPNTLSIQAGPEAIYGDFEAGHSKEDKISAVHFVRFRIPSGFLEQLLVQDTPVFIKLCLDQYRAETQVPPEIRREWLIDLGIEQPGN